MNKKVIPVTSAWLSNGSKWTVFKGQLLKDGSKCVALGSFRWYHYVNFWAVCTIFEWSCNFCATIQDFVLFYRSTWQIFRPKKNSFPGVDEWYNYLCKVLNIRNRTIYCTAKQTNKRNKFFIVHINVTGQARKCCEGSAIEGLLLLINDISERNLIVNRICIRVRLIAYLERL